MNNTHGYGVYDCGRPLVTVEGHFTFGNLLNLRPSISKNTAFLPAARDYIARVSAVVVSVYPSDTSWWCSTETVKRRITQTTPYDSPGLWFSVAKNLGKTRTGSRSTGAPNAGGVG